MTRVLKKVFLVLMGVMIVLITVFLWYRSASRPQIEGVVKLAGLTAEIDVVRDKEGIPHIYAQSSQDAYFALGFVHAQDRLWQLDLNRRISAGNMAEILGLQALETDRFLRTLGVRRNAEKIFFHLSADTRTALESYAKGVNAYLANRTGPLPPEFLITGAPSPAPWQPADSLGWQTMMAWDLGANWSQEILRMKLAQHLSLDQINAFLPPNPGDPVMQTRDYTGFFRELTGMTKQLEKVAAIAPSSYVEGMGSNNWVVAGALSETGKPLLANDPHLGLSAPSLWYLAHLSAPGMNVIGATLPGIPSVVLGHNDHIAWGLTNTGPDVQDLYIERIHPENRKQYQTPNGWRDFFTHEEIIKVKGQPDVVLEVNETRHGPVITGALPIIDKTAIDTKNYVVSFAWTALRSDDLTLQASLKFNWAKNWQEFLEGARDFGAPQQNVVYADIEGNIGFIAPGRIPVRAPENDLKGLVPAPGWDAHYDWKGFIPFEALPQEFNPASHRIITANQKIVASDYPYFLTSEWALPYRADRINVLLDRNAKHSISSFADMQKDHVSLAAKEILPLLRTTIPRSERARLALKALADWHGEMDAHRPEPLIFNAWLRMASRQIFGDELGSALMEDYWEQRNVHLSMLNVLSNKDGQAIWCRNVTQPPDVKQQSCADVLSASLETALADLEKRYGKTMSEWRWGEAHIARSEHRPFGKAVLLAGIFDIRVGTPGDTYTINAGRHSLRNEKEPFTNSHAAGFRVLYDLSNLENSRFIQSTGQSGNIFSPLYRNYSQRWADVSYLPMKTRRSEVEKDSMAILRLIP